MDVILLHTAVVILVQVEDIKLCSRSRLERWYHFIITKSVCSGGI